MTVPSHVYHINSDGGNVFDDDQHHRKLPAIDSEISCGRFRQTNAVQRNNNKNANYMCASNGDLTASGRLQNFSNINNIQNNNCNRSHKVAVKTEKNVGLYDGTDDGDNNDVNRTINGNGSYSIFDAISNAVTSGNCTNAIYPASNRNDGDLDQINLSPDPNSMHKNASSHINNECGQYQQYSYHLNTRTHQFPSVNYKHSYLLWIGTPVAAR